MHLVFVSAIIASVVAVLGVFQPAGWVWALSLVWVFLFAVLNYDHHSDRVSILNGLKRRDNALVYTKLVDAMLGGLKRMLSPPDAVNDPMPAKGWSSRLDWFLTPRACDPDDLMRLQSSTFSWPVMDAALKIAIIYPLLLLLVQWGLGGAETGLGPVTILAAEERHWLRAALVCPLVALVIARMLVSASQMRVFEKASDWLLFLAFAFAGTVAGAFAFAVAVAGAGVVAGAFAVAVAVAFAVAVAGAVAVAFAVAFAVAVAVAFAGAVGYGSAKGKGGRSYAMLVIGLWTALVGAFALSTDALEQEPRVLLFALGLLPLVNAVFDYLSYGVTLGLIRYGRGQRNVLTGLVWLLDGVVAVLLLIGLGLGLSGTIALINHLAGQEFIGLRPIFDDLKTPEGRAGYTWLTFTLLSTLVPTLVHLLLVFLSGFTWVPQRFKRWIARGIGESETGDLATLGGSAAAATLGALWAGLVACGLWGIWLFVTAYLEPAGLAVLWAVESVAHSLGWVESGAVAVVAPDIDI